MTKVALAAAEAGVPFAILPFGTANNIGKSLELTGQSGPLVDSLEAEALAPRRFDLRIAAGPWGEARFVEGIGGGPMADLLAAKEVVGHPTALMGRETDRALHVLVEIVERAVPDVWGVMADGSDRSGEYLGVELLNIAFAGPNIPLAPNASPTDGTLDLVLLTEDDRKAVVAYLDDRLKLATGTLPPLTRLSVSEVELHPPPGVRMRLDDAGWPNLEPLETGARVRARILPGAARIALRR